MCASSCIRGVLGLCSLAVLILAWLLPSVSLRCLLGRFFDWSLVILAVVGFGRAFVFLAAMSSRQAAFFCCSVGFGSCLVSVVVLGFGLAGGVSGCDQHVP